jgi:hypothetical protein
MFASVLTDSEGLILPIHAMTDFRIETLAAISPFSH